MGLLRLILNVIWLVLCGWWMAILYFLAGLIAFILIITIPFGIAAWRIGGDVLWPFGRQIERRRDAGGPSLIGNIIWIIPLGLANFKIIPISLWPLGVRITSGDPF